MTHYTLGFLFSPNLKNVVLVRKNRPKWQAGLLNGVGGHVEEGELFLETMVREFREETGLEVLQWTRFGTLICPDAILGLFFSTSEDYNTVTSVTDEEILVRNVDGIMDLASLDIQLNIRWLIQMAISFTQGERCPAFTITEAYTPQDYI